jgi:hypothetical protein
MHTPDGYTSIYGVDKSVKDDEKEEKEMMGTWIMDGFFFFLI